MISEVKVLSQKFLANLTVNLYHMWFKTSKSFILLTAITDAKENLERITKGHGYLCEVLGVKILSDQMI
jgi:hypothetical protein